MVPNVDYRNSDGSSDYNALTALLRYRTGRAFLQASYTWSHTIDVQSDALAGDFFNLNFTVHRKRQRHLRARHFCPAVRPRTRTAAMPTSTSARILCCRAIGIPAPVFSRIADPVSVPRLELRHASRHPLRLPVHAAGDHQSSPIGGGLILSNRPDLIDPAHAQEYQPNPSYGGVTLLNVAAFANAAKSTLGNVGTECFYRSQGSIISI